MLHQIHDTFDQRIYHFTHLQMRMRNYLMIQLIETVLYDLFVFLSVYFILQSDYRNILRA